MADPQTYIMSLLVHVLLNCIGSGLKLCWGLLVVQTNLTLPMYQCGIRSVLSLTQHVEPTYQLHLSSPTFLMAMIDWLVLLMGHRGRTGEGIDGRASLVMGGRGCKL